MKIPYRQRWLLRRMDRRLRRSDPHMAAMLAIFARLNAGAVITSEEQAGPPATRVRRGLTWLGSAIGGIAGCLAACACWVFRRVGSTCAAVRRRFSGGARATQSGSYAARSSMRRDGPGLPAS